METKVLDYRIIIKPHKEGRKTIYLAECPTLGVYDWGDTVELVLKSIQEGIECEIEGLIMDKTEIPLDHVEQEFVTSARVKLPRNFSISLSS